uniref:SET domain-containing protein n=1 Tax=Caenorhabditis tropicalis TaxID=1561998 RepID=A0A1I7TPE4_9PELO
MFRWLFSVEAIELVDRNDFQSFIEAEKEIRHRFQNDPILMTIQRKMTLEIRTKILKRRNVPTSLEICLAPKEFQNGTESLRSDGKRFRIRSNTTDNANEMIPAYCHISRDLDKEFVVTAMTKVQLLGERKLSMLSDRHESEGVPVSRTRKTSSWHHGLRELTLFKNIIGYTDFQESRSRSSPEKSWRTTGPGLRFPNFRQKGGGQVRETHGSRGSELQRLFTEAYTKNVWMIDPKKIGNMARMFNHSCQTNVEFVRVFQKSFSPSNMRLLVVPNVFLGEELTFNYKDAYLRDHIQFCGTDACLYNQNVKKMALSQVI